MRLIYVRGGNLGTSGFRSNFDVGIDLGKCTIHLLVDFACIL